MRHVIAGARIFDGIRFWEDHALVLDDGRITAILPAGEAGTPTEKVQGIIAPGFLDLQVNGGGGLMVDGTTDPDALRTICDTHRQLGCAGVLPTLITDTPQATARVIDAGVRAARMNMPGFLGLHLEGPHLDPRRKGAHDPALVRPMEDADLAILCDAARALPALMVTLAPEAATPRQIRALAGAGAIISLGHSDCDHETACRAYDAGASCATHLFNAMSQMGHRSPGMVGAVLAGEGFAGLIADGIHVHPAAMRAALRARPDGIFLVSDCMAFAGTDMTRMALNGRPVLRGDGRLTLADGTLAGADLRMDRAIATLVGQVGITPERALAMAALEPARAIGLSDRFGMIAAGRHADLVLLGSDLSLTGIWQEDGWREPLAA
ncbi:N-acetylglucosamine-6-phosphate deacetylase [Paracoccus sp. R12_1]|uniref:N-acetylglucosamine-6-phosphate deacetylase n=1 Tax=unclassified Paracoccus (in: a-proteobacteria) TaxID=2688777 RepID=UPI001AD9D7E4|nr:MULTISPECIES: N-acetylglucosamine-6-phosphate deacetylase [unclassified Paracoccus (in: a-proteobacteria)]MBO9453889.1 N-acetylglucosamine-6-phosphate deacetylase [Paracoccus sp. R12_2]MBO9485763.1 N-acetylglucosamine-6-phosphate deacetylase [Paracoccus sp. R12_1]